jgi:hypothetical protein
MDMKRVKAVMMLVAFLLSLSALALLEVHLVNAEISGVQFSSYKTTTGANQPVEITVYVVGGTPPYTYQWRTEFVPKEIVDSPYFPFPAMLDGRIVRVNVSGATSPTFNFVSSTPGTYNIVVDIVDSKGSMVAASSGPFIVVAPLGLSASDVAPSPPAESPSPPKVVVLSPENKTYNETSLLLTFAVSEYTSKVSYVLDGVSNVTVAGNLTMSNLPNGQHNVTFYATDLAGNIGASETIIFAVDKANAFPIMPVTASAGVAAVVVSAAALVYLKKRKR